MRMTEDVPLCGAYEPPRGLRRTPEEAAWLAEATCTMHLGRLAGNVPLFMQSETCEDFVGRRPLRPVSADLRTGPFLRGVGPGRSRRRRQREARDAERRAPSP